MPQTSIVPIMQGLGKTKTFLKYAKEHNLPVVVLPVASPPLFEDVHGIISADVADAIGLKGGKRYE